MTKEESILSVIIDTREFDGLIDQSSQLTPMPTMENSLTPGQKLEEKRR